LALKKVLMNHVVTLIVVVTVFFLGFSVGSMLNDVKTTILSDKFSDIQNEIDSLEFGLLLTSTLENLTCPFLRSQVTFIHKEAQEIGDKIISYENQEQVDLEQYKRLKKEYMLVRLKYWSLSERLKNACDEDFTTILYFYSVNNCADCKSQGEILDYLQQRIPKQVYVFPVDMYEDLVIMNILRTAYNITQAPSLIIDGNVVLHGLQGNKELTTFLCNKYNDTLSIC